MKTHNVFVACDTLRHANYYADEFIKKYCHRIIGVKSHKLDLTTKYDKENEVRVLFVPIYELNHKILGYRNIRCITGEVSELVNFDSLSDILEIPVYRD